jgi:mannose-6-phosphate isomerase-like protein (cupin superfamily)
MNVAELEKKLHSEGFAHTYIWQDGPEQHLFEHAHPVETAHIILEGEITLTVDGRSATYRAGERCDVAAGIVHAARMGPAGCRYLIGEK